MKIRISKKDRQNNELKKTYKMAKNDIQSTTQKPKDRTARTSLNTGVKLDAFKRGNSSYSTSGTRRTTLIANRLIRHESENIFPKLFDIIVTVNSQLSMK